MRCRVVSCVGRQCPLTFVGQRAKHDHALPSLPSLRLLLALHRRRTRAGCAVVVDDEDAPR
eukprot:11912402-Alexandrium_andersonii.AAC.1